MTAVTRGEVHATAAPTPEPDPKRWRALTVIAIAQLMVVLDATIVNIALPQASRSLHIAQANQQWMVTAYSLSFGALLLLGGRIADYTGRKKIFLIGLIGFAGASALGGAAPDQGFLFAARALQGAFGALLAPAALSLITVTFTEAHERARAFAVYGAIAGGGAAVGLLLGGVLTEYANWRFCLFVNIPIALIAASLAIPFVQESKAGGRTSYDIPGALLVSTGLASLVFGLNKAADAHDGWGSATTLTFLVIAALTLTGFVLVELRTATPLLPLRVVLDRNRGGSYLTSLIVGSGLFAMFLFLSLYLQQVLHYSPVRSGLAFLPFSAGIIVAAGVASQLLPRVGPKALMMAGLTLGTGGILLLTDINLQGQYVTHILPAMLLISLGMGLNFVPLSSTALIGVASRDAGVASALVNASQQVGGSVGTALLITLYTGSFKRFFTSHPHIGPIANMHGLPNPLAAVHGYHTAFIWGGALLFTALVLTTLLIRARRDDVPADGVIAAAL